MDKRGHMTTAEVLESARYLIHIPEWWTQGASGRDKRGHRCATTDSACYSRCMAGAICAVTIQNGIADSLLEGVASNYVYFNDTHTHAEVLQKMDQAIDIAKERGL